ncbi:MAG: hypothetical protein JW750_03720 [Anaerolineaceae bacterium]|nr:hypothetical protein [Anaerolineaceae bacterium]
MFSFFLIVAAIGAVLWMRKKKSVRPMRQETITLLPDRPGQMIEGFGASGAWWAQAVGGWEDGSRERIIECLFDRRKGIGLSIFRYNIGAGDGETITDEWRRAETFEIAPGEYDWTRDANALRVTRLACASGVEQIVAFVNSPPARMTVSGQVSGAVDGKSNLRPEMIGDFAKYLVDVVVHLRDVEGLPITYLSPINEPRWRWKERNGQEGCHYTSREVARMLRAAQDELDRRGVKVGLSAHESGRWQNSQVFLLRMTRDAKLARALDHFAIHSYVSGPAGKQALRKFIASRWPEKNIWMSEWTEMRGRQDTGMESALTLAKTIHEDLTVGGVSSWQYWIAVSKYDWRDGLIYVSEDDHTPVETKRLWVMGQFSRFVRPGFRRMETASAYDLLLASAFLAPDARQWVMVVINPHGEAVRGSVRSGRFEQFTRLSAFITDESHDLTAIYEGGALHEFLFPKRSVVTLVYDQ